MPQVPRRARVVAAVLIVLGSAPAAFAQGGAAVRVNAGLDGTVRPGRWTTIDVTIENSGRALAGDLIVEIGSARTVSQVEVPAPSKKRVDLYLRVPSDAGRTVTVSFAALDPVRVPLRVADDAPIHVCVGTAPSADCTVALDAGAAPQSWRGYDAADTVVIADRSGLTPRQQVAYERWRAIRHWSASTNMVPPPSAPPTVDGTSPVTRVLVTYLLILIVACVAAPSIRVRPMWVHAALASIIVVASAVVLADGRIGSGADVSIADTTVVRGAEGFAGSSIAARGVARFPAASRHELVTPLDDASMDVPAAGDFKKGEKLSFNVEGFSRSAIVESTRADRRLTLSNVSAFHLDACSLPEGFDPRELRHLPPAGRATVQMAGEPVDPVLTCTIRGTLDTLQVRDARIRHTGTTTLLYDLRPLEDPR